MLLKSRRSEELVCFYSRCRYIGRLKGLTTLLSENSSPQSHCHSEETAEVPPVADTARRFQESVPVFMPQRGWKPADTILPTFPATGNISRRRHVPYEKGPAGRTAPIGDTTQKYSSASEMLPTQKGTCHGTFLFAGHFFVSVVIRLLSCFSFAPQGRGCCWVMQWILPPPKATSRVCTPTTSRSGNISCT